MRGKKLLSILIVCGVFFIGQFGFGQARKPDLKVVSFTISPPNPTTADTIRFIATIRNVGLLKSGTSKGAIQVGGESNPKVYLIPPLNPGQKDVIVRKIKLSTPMGYVAKAYADYENVIKESNETNNIYTRNFMVKKYRPLPDLVLCISCGKVFWLSQRRSIDVYVKNIGKVSSPACKLNIYAEKKGTHIYNVPPLRPNEVYHVRRNVIWRVGTGHKRINAYVDKANVVDEISNRNNFVETKYKVGLPLSAMGGIGCPCRGIVRNNMHNQTLCCSYSRRDEKQADVQLMKIKLK